MYSLGTNDPQEGNARYFRFGHTDVVFVCEKHSLKATEGHAPASYHLHDTDNSLKYASLLTMFICT